MLTDETKAQVRAAVVEYIKSGKHTLGGAGVTFEFYQACVPIRTPKGTYDYALTVFEDLARKGAALE